ncbi:MAG: ferric reductase-like transmembrane domain-containing protein [Alphaproteobacteria bacterium]
MTDTSPSPQRAPLWGWTSEGWGIVIAVSVGVGTMVGLILANVGIDEEGYGLAIRSTARTTLIFFLIAYLASPLMRLSGGNWARGLLRNRRYWGVGAAISHAFHFVLIWALMDKFYDGDWIAASGLTTVIFGGLGFAFFFAMALTSTNGWIRRLGPKNWRLLHTLGLHYIWAIFTGTLLLGQLAEGPQAIQAFEIAALVIALGIRLVAQRESR